MTLRLVVPMFVAVALLGACGSSGGGSDSKPAGSDGGDRTSSSDKGDGEASVEIVDFGFGVSDGVIEGIVIVTTNSEAAIGESVTVTANFLDSDGQIVATEEQVESFNWVGQELLLPVSHYPDGASVKIASIDPSVSLSDYGTTEPQKAPLPVLEASEIKKGEFGGYAASFGFTNETDTDLKDLRVGVACFDDAKKIIGGTSAYPGLAPVGKTIRIDADPTVSGKPSMCKAYVNYDVF